MGNGQWAMGMPPPLGGQTKRRRQGTAWDAQLLGRWDRWAGSVGRPLAVAAPLVERQRRHRALLGRPGGFIPGGCPRPVGHHGLELTCPAGGSRRRLLPLPARHRSLGRRHRQPGRQLRLLHPPVGRCDRLGGREPGLAVGRGSVHLPVDHDRPALLLPRRQLGLVHLTDSIQTYRDTRRRAQSGGDRTTRGETGATQIAGGGGGAPSSRGPSPAAWRRASRR